MVRLVSLFLAFALVASISAQSLNCSAHNDEGCDACFGENFVCR